MAAARRQPRPDRSPRRPTERRKQRRGFAPTSAILAAIALAVAAGVAYATSFSGVFIFDDQYASQFNPNIKTLWPLTVAMSAPPETRVTARPVANLTLNCALAPPGVGERFLRTVWGYHVVNLALHVLAAPALFGVVRRTLVSNRLAPRFGGVSGWRSRWRSSGWCTRC